MVVLSASVWEFAKQSIFIITDHLLVGLTKRYTQRINGFQLLMNHPENVITHMTSLDDVIRSLIP